MKIMNKNIPVLHDWFFTGGDDNHDPDPTPKKTGAVCGKVYGHATRPDGSKITTSAIANVKGRIIYTASGSTYRLGRVSRAYVKWLKKNGLRWEPQNPIRMHGSV